jgi:hypothetical protein
MRAKVINEEYNSIHLGQTNIDVLMPDNIPSEEAWSDLWALSTFKSETGFDFMVEKSYIATWISDFRGDKRTSKNIDWFEEILETMKSNYLYIKQR